MNSTWKISFCEVKQIQVVNELIYLTFSLNEFDYDCPKFLISYLKLSGNRHNLIHFRTLIIMLQVSVLDFEMQMLLRHANCSYINMNFV